MSELMSICIAAMSFFRLGDSGAAAWRAGSSRARTHGDAPGDLAPDLQRRMADHRTRHQPAETLGDQFLDVAFADMRMPAGDAVLLADREHVGHRRYDRGMIVLPRHA